MPPYQSQGPGMMPPPNAVVAFLRFLMQQMVQGKQGVAPEPRQQPGVSPSDVWRMVSQPPPGLGTILANTLADLSPGVGNLKGFQEGIMGRNMLTDEKYTPWMRGLMGGSSLIPFAGIFKGVKAFGKGAKHLDKAQSLAKQGVQSEAIRSNTGWFQNPYDKKWRFEIDDSKAIFKKQPRMNDTTWGTVGEMLDHDELYEAYPEIKNTLIKVEIDPKTKSGTGSYNPGESREAEGLFDIEPEIHIKAPSLKEAKSTLIHEVQHAVQEIEGFARG